MTDRLPFLPPAEHQAYRLLLRMTGAGPGDLAAQAGIDAGEAAALLESLRDRGLATGGPPFEALPPDVALGEVLLREQQDLEAARRMVASLSEEYRTTARRRSADHLVEIVVGVAGLRQRLREMQDAAREEILWFCRANPIAMQGPDNTEETPALTRGVRYRAIYERELLEKPGELDSILEAIGLGEQSRTLPTLPVRLAIADRTMAICPLVPDAVRGVGEPTAAVIRPASCSTR